MLDSDWSDVVWSIKPISRFFGNNKHMNVYDENLTNIDVKKKNGTVNQMFCTGTFI